MAQGHKCGTVTVVSSISTFIFTFLSSGVEAQYGVAFRQHATPSGLSGNREQSIFTLSSLCLPCYVRDIA